MHSLSTVQKLSFTGPFRQRDSQIKLPRRAKSILKSELDDLYPELASAQPSVGCHRKRLSDLLEGVNQLSVNELDDSAVEKEYNAGENTEQAKENRSPLHRDWHRSSRKIVGDYPSSIPGTSGIRPKSSDSSDDENAFEEYVSSVKKDWTAKSRVFHGNPAQRLFDPEPHEQDDCWIVDESNKVLDSFSDDENHDDPSLPNPYLSPSPFPLAKRIPFLNKFDNRNDSPTIWRDADPFRKPDKDQHSGDSCSTPLMSRTTFNRPVISTKVTRHKPTTIACRTPRLTTASDPIVRRRPATSPSSPDDGMYSVEEAHQFLISLGAGNGFDDRSCENYRVQSKCPHPAALPYLRHFARNRVRLAQELYQIFNRHVFKSKLPAEMEIVWPKRLLRTAGRTVYQRKAGVRSASIELSVKVLDNPARVRDTLVHEMCHAMVWLQYDVKIAHGKHWKCWARTVTQVFYKIPLVTRCHDYEIQAKYIYRCQRCFYSIKRHSKSIDTTKMVCGVCTGTFQLFLNAEHISMKSTPAAKNRNTGVDSIPMAETPRALTGFAKFVKENYSEVKKQSTGPAMKHKDVMQMLSAKFRNELAICFEDQ